MPGTLLSSATTNGTGTAQTITGGTTLLLSGVIGPQATVLIEIASATGPFVPFETMKPGGDLTKTIHCGNSAAEFRLRATLAGVVPGDNTNATLEFL